MTHDRRKAACTASLSTDGLGNLLPPRPLVGSVGVGSSIEKVLMFVEIIPGVLADVMREPFESIAHRSGQVNDAIGFESLHDAIVDAERICTGVLRDVEPQNLLFIFGQTLQSLCYAAIASPPEPPLLYEGDTVADNGHHKECSGDDKDKPKHRAVVLCKLKHSDELEKFFAGKEQEGGHDSKRYEVAWSELQELKKRLSGFSDHGKRPNV